MTDTFEIPVITVSQDYISIFDQIIYSKETRGGMLLSDRIEAQNFRIRESEPGYISDWHVAGDATFISILQGALRIELRDGTSQEFGPGSMFIAQDYLPESMAFDSTKHGHRAMVQGDKTLKAVHIKLSADFRS